MEKIITLITSPEFYQSEKCSLSIQERGTRHPHNTLGILFEEEKGDDVYNISDVLSALQEGKGIMSYTQKDNKTFALLSLSMDDPDTYIQGGEKKNPLKELIESDEFQGFEHVIFHVGIEQKAIIAYAHAISDFTCLFAKQSQICAVQEYLKDIRKGEWSIRDQI